MTKIVGIFLIRNEDRFIRHAVKNVLAFCDEIILLDNNSTDSTYRILETLQKQHPEKIRLYRLPNALHSHHFIEDYADSDTWIFAVDGDEIYDRHRLKKFREDILAGTYKDYWNIFGNCIHVKKIDTFKKIAYGYMSPPSRSITKLYNFNAITEWKEEAERLHGKNMKFKKGFDESKMLLLHDVYTWETSPFRCLHACFIERSSKPTISQARFNPSENVKPYFAILNFFRNLAHGSLSLQSSYKLKKYKRGNLQRVSIEPFIEANDEA